MSFDCSLIGTRKLLMRKKYLLPWLWQNTMFIFLKHIKRKVGDASTICISKRNLPQENYWHVCNLGAMKILFLPWYTSIQDYIYFLPLYLRGIWNIKEGWYCFLEHKIDSLMNNFRNSIPWGINKSLATIILGRKVINRYSMGFENGHRHKFPLSIYTLHALLLGFA